MKLVKKHVELLSPTFEKFSHITKHTYNKYKVNVYVPLILYIQLFVTFLNTRDYLRPFQSSMKVDSTYCHPEYATILMNNTTITYFIDSLRM